MSIAGYLHEKRSLIENREDPLFYFLKGLRRGSERERVSLIEQSKNPSIPCERANINLKNEKYFRSLLKSSKICDSCES